MGELLLKHGVGNAGIIVESAGTHGLNQAPIDPSAARLLERTGIDSSSFRSRRLTPQLAKKSDLILCFEAEQRRETVILSPICVQRTFVLTDFANMCEYCDHEGYVEGSDFSERLQSVVGNASMLRPMLPETEDIEDPYQRDFDVFEHVYARIGAALKTIIRVACAN